MMLDRAECREVCRHGVIREVASHDLCQPFPLLGDRLVPAPAHLLLDLLERRPHAIPPGFPLEEELACARTPADEGEAQKNEGLRLAEPPPSSSGRRLGAGTDQ